MIRPRLDRTLLLGVVRCVGMLCVAASSAPGKEARATFTVTATVNPTASIQSLTVPAAIDVSAADIERGYVDAAEPTALTIRSNSPNGFALEVMTVEPLAAAMVVGGFGPAQSLGAQGGTLIERWASPHPVNLALTFRLFLAPGLLPGHYPWPMRLAVRPLE